MNEIWKDIPNSHYQASSLGNIKNKKTGRVLKSHVNDNGVCNVVIYYNKVKKNRFVHRLVMEAFHGIHDKWVGHIDKNKLNNRIENLRFREPC